MRSWPLSARGAGASLVAEISFGPEYGVEPIIGSPRAQARDLPAVVDATGNAEPEFSCARQGSEIGHFALLPQKSVISPRSGEARAHDLSTIVDILKSVNNLSARQCPEIGDLALLPQESVELARSRVARAHDLLTAVDSKGFAPVTARQGSEIGHFALL